MADTPLPADALAALRASGVPARDPVRWRLAEALARRASAHAGAARRVLDDRLAGLIATLSMPREPAACAPRPTPTGGPLAELAAHAARHKSTLLSGAMSKTAPAQATGSATDAGTVQFFKRTWSRLSADQRLAQSRAALPENAGPLNSQHLVHRALTLMHELSPEYLERFVGYIDALQWLEQADEAAAQEATVRPGGARRSMAARR
jgi:hypothetical protein